MTTIAFDGEYLVADGRVTRDKEIITDTDLKITPCDFEYIVSGNDVRVQVTAFACSGSVNIIEDFEYLFKRRKQVKDTELNDFILRQQKRAHRTKWSFSVILVTDCGNFLCLGTHGDHQPSRTLKDGDVVVLGSGSIHCVNLYRSAFDAVKHACIKDPYTGGVIRYYNCRTKEAGICTEEFLIQFRLQQKYKAICVSLNKLFVEPVFSLVSRLWTSVSHLLPNRFIN